MKAVVLTAPHKIELQDKPKPTLQAPTDVIIKTSLAALCGSDLHQYRGHPVLPTYGFTMGHEVIGTVEEVGAEIKSFKKGDHVVSPFTISCGECQHCKWQQTSRCVQNKLFGSPVLEGCQAEYVRIPLAESTLYHAPDNVPEESLILMADIFPTGFNTVRQGLHLLSEPERESADVVILGCGPVGLCAITSATHFFNKDRIIAVDSVPERLAEAKRHGASHTINLAEENVAERVKELTGGKGADVVCEVVGSPQALQLALDLVRPWGAISSCGVHTHEIPISGGALYAKNVKMQFGRCPVRAVFKPAMDILVQHADLFKTFVQHRVKPEQAPEFYEKFDKRQVLKTVFDFNA
ncbi:hypothetical protein OC844_002564 [Tilletia horrida]|nr:hypothetical protein OC844_002564 [Tilletia horrida]